MPYDSIPGSPATFLDGSLIETPATSQPKILVLGSASGGLNLQPFAVTNTSQAEVEFGSSSEVMRGVHEALGQNANNISVVRIGGSQGTFVLTDSDGDTLTITPERRDDTVHDRYGLILENVSGANRIIVYDIISESFVYDTSDILALDEGVVEVVDTGLDLFTVGDQTDLTVLVSFTDQVIGDFTVTGTATMTTVLATAGTDGTAMSLCERYAALNTAYHLLDFEDADFVYPTDVQIDDANMVTDASPTADFYFGVPTLGSITDELGHLWQYIHQGALYTYFVDSATFFTDEGTAAAATLTLTTNTSLSITALKTGVGGNNISIVIDSTVSTPPIVTTVLTPTSLAITVTCLAASDDTAAIAAAIIADPVAGLWVTAAGDATLSATEALDNLAAGTGGAFLSHSDLTGDTVPAAVTTRFGTGVDAESREANFGHQLASFCYLASTTWKTMIGAISALGPASYSRTAVATWAGSIPTFTQIGLDKAITQVSDNGTGLLGVKFMSGKSITSAGYRNQLVVEGNSTDGYAYGGWIATKGASLPNPEFPYGILDSDEATDAGGAPIDIGKHLLVTYDWPIHRNAFNGGGSYRGSIPGIAIGKIAVMPVNEEPIGQNGLLLKVTSPPRVHSTQQDQLASVRMIGLRREAGVGFILVSAKTAAHPDSDYVRLSTIRSVNREVDGIRTIAKKYIGGAFSAERLLSLQAAIDGFLQAERKAGFNQGAVASISYTRSDKILGKLKVRLKMVPPFSIEQITVETSIAADESEL